MKGGFALIGFVLLLSSVLTLSHALLRSASIYPSMELSWLIRVGSALILYGLVFAFYSYLLKYYDISVLFPAYTACSLIGVFFTGVFYFGEELSFYKIIGVVILMVGAILITM